MNILQLFKGRNSSEHNMQIIAILDDLKKQYEKNCIVRKNGTMLLAPSSIPKCRHMLFKPLSDRTIRDYLSNAYKGKIPEEYTSFLKYSNGANLFTVKIEEPEFSYAFCLFIVYGLPMTPPFSRPSDMEEPYDIRVEDLARHNDIPNTWLKCGRYIKNYDFDVEYDIFIDTLTGKVYSVEKNKDGIIDCWETFDKCLCDIFDSFSNVVWNH